MVCGCMCTYMVCVCVCVNIRCVCMYIVCVDVNIWCVQWVYVYGVCGCEHMVCGVCVWCVDVYGAGDL